MIQNWLTLGVYIPATRVETDFKRLASTKGHDLRMASRGILILAIGLPLEPVSSSPLSLGRGAVGRSR